MRADELDPIIIARIEALTPPGAGAANVKFLHDADYADEATRPEFTFQLLEGHLSPSQTFAPLTITTFFQLRMFFVNAPTLRNIARRAGELVMTSLYGLGRLDHQDCHGISEMGDWVPTDGVEGQVVCELDFAVTYTLTGV